MYVKLLVYVNDIFIIGQFRFLVGGFDVVNFCLRLVAVFLPTIQYFFNPASRLL